MRKGILVVCALGLLLVQPAAADEFFAPDKIAHFSGSAAAGFAVGTIAYHYGDKLGPVGEMGRVGRTLTAAAIGIVPGLIIEIVDGATGASHGFSEKDLAADALGSLTGAVTAELFNGWFFVSVSKKKVTIGARF